MAELEEDIAELLRKHQAETGKLLTIGSVESATGGRIGDKVTNVPGSSDYYKGSIIAYSNEAKTRIVGVKEETIFNHGAVSPETAIEMAKGGRKLLNVDICISDTGIAGPAGTTPEKPVGLFYFGLSDKDTALTQEHRFQGSREENKRKATETALKLLKEHLVKHSARAKDGAPEEKHVVTCFLEYGNKILILKRSGKVSTYQGHWAGVSGYMETGDLEQALIEINEETGLDKDDVELLVTGEPLEIIDDSLNRTWIIHVFLFHVKTPEKIVINWENAEAKWIKPEELVTYQTVPGLNEALKRVIKQT